MGASPLLVDAVTTPSVCYGSWQIWVPMGALPLNPIKQTYFSHAYHLCIVYSIMVQCIMQQNLMSDILYPFLVILPTHMAFLFHKQYSILVHALRVLLAHK